MKKILFCILFLSIFIFSCLSSFSAPDFNPVQIIGDLESSGSIRFVETSVGTSVVGYFSFPVDRYYQIDSAYLGNYSIPLSMKAFLSSIKARDIITRLYSLFLIQIFLRLILVVILSFWMYLLLLILRMILIFLTYLMMDSILPILIFLIE